MPITFYIYREERLLLSHYSGDVGDDDFIRSYSSVLGSDKYELGLDELVDMTDLPNIRVSEKGIDAVQSLVTEKYVDSTHRIRTAIVAPKDVIFGVSRMYELYNDEERSAEEIMVFRTHSAALQWLKRDPGLIQDDTSREQIIP